jgi:hypothetical protein
MPVPHRRFPPCRPVAACSLALALLGSFALPVAARADGADLRLRLCLRDGDREPACVEFGFLGGALLGQDGLDLPAPPLPPSDYLMVSFALPQGGEPYPNRWLTDYRAPADFADDAETWTVTIASDQPRGGVALSLSFVGGVGGPLRAALAGLAPADIELDLPGGAVVVVPAGETTFDLILEDVHVPARTASWGCVKAIYD